MRKKTLRIISLLGLVVIVSVIYVITSRFALPRQAASPAASPTAYPTTDATVTPIQPAVVQAAQIQSIPTQIPQSASSTLALTPDSPPTLRPKNTPTRAPTRTPRNTPTATIRCQKATPIVTAASLGSVNLSPSGQWAAYWVSTPEDFARMQGYRPPAALYFTNLQTGQTCPRPELTRLDEYPPVEGACPMNYGPVQWSDDESTVIVITERGFFTGQPCQTKPFKQEANDGWHLLASDISYPNWNTNWSQVAYGHTRNNQIIWQTFPEGENLGCWDTDPYNTSQIIFSPDGCTLLTLGNRPGERGDGLFALNRCLPSPTPTLPPPQTQGFTMLADAQAAARFTILAPAFVPEGLFLDKVTVMDYEDGSQTVQITYAEDYTGEILDANRKFVFVWLTSGGSPVTLDSLKSTFKEVAWDILPVTVRGQAGFSYWMPANAAGNSAWLAWNEGDLTISIAMYGDWPQPTEADPHGLDEILFNIAKSLK